MSSHEISPHAEALHRSRLWLYVFAGLCASLDSIGLARFAFTPLLPELIQARWFTPSSAVYLGAANLLGYLCGALAARTLAAHMPKEHALRLMMVLITAAFFGCAFPLSFAWYFGWRFVSGIAGGVVMVLVTATVLPHVPPARKGMASGAVFLGLGLGIACSGTLIPLLLGAGLAETWMGLGVLSAVLTLASWFAWPAPVAGLTARIGTQVPHGMRFGRDVWLLYVQYAMMAMAAVPPMVFLVDYIARGLGWGTRQGSLFWAIYGLGAIAGPPLYGLLADRLGAKTTIRLVSVVIGGCLAAMATVHDVLWLGVLTAIIGTFAPGTVPLALARVHEIVEHHAPQNLAWMRASIVGASAIAAGAYGSSALFNATGGNHPLLFLASAGLLALTLLCTWLGNSSPRAAPAQPPRT